MSKFLTNKELSPKFCIRFMNSVFIRTERTLSKRLNPAVCVGTEKRARALTHSH